MTKKEFKTNIGTFDEVLSGVKKDKKKATCPEIKTSFIVKSYQFDKIKAISYLERKMMKQILSDALEEYIDNYEQKNGTLQLPKKN